MPSFAVILPAAGRSLRFGQNKLLANLCGKPVITHAAEAFLARSDVTDLIIATNDPALLSSILPGDPRCASAPAASTAPTP